MKWIAKYNFFELYPKTNKMKAIEPLSEFRFYQYKMINDSVIFLSGNKETRFIEGKSGKRAVIIISKDLGKNYQEIDISEGNVTEVLPSEKYTLIEINGDEKNYIYLLDNSTLQYRKIDEYSSEDNRFYNQFNGEYIYCTINGIRKICNPFTKEEYILPIEFKNVKLKQENSENFIYLDKNELKQFNAKNKTTKIVKSFNDDYDVMGYDKGEITLGKINLIKTKINYYNLDEKELYTETEKTDYYRYKNFACNYIHDNINPIIEYSYDYGKTWKKYVVNDFFITPFPIGYYKDKYIIFAAAFYGKNNSEERGGRIVVGEFQK